MESNRPMDGRQPGISTRTSNRRPLLKSLIWLVVHCFLVGKAIHLPAQDQLRIDPPQVVFEGASLMQEVILTNIAADTAIYRISFIQYRVTEHGAFETVEEPDPGQQFASPFLRYFPMQVGLAPGESKRFLLQVKRRDQMEEGEYRSHLLFRDIVPAWRAGTEASLEKEPDHPSMPVFVIHGNTSARAEVTEATIHLQNGEPPMLKVTIARSGNRSVTGDLEVIRRPPGQAPVSMARMQDLTIYAPTELRHASLPLPTLSNPTQDADSLIVRFNYSGASIEKMIPIKQFSPE